MRRPSRAVPAFRVVQVYTFVYIVPVKFGWDDNPMGAAKVELGRYLFYDKRLSFNQKQACAGCHEQSRAFTDGRGRARGSTGQMHPRSSMSLVNVAYVSALGWANPGLTQLEAQALVPMFGDSPVELGMKGREELLQSRLRKVPEYQRLFPAAFPNARARRPTRLPTPAYSNTPGAEPISGSSACRHCAT